MLAFPDSFLSRPKCYTCSIGYIGNKGSSYRLGYSKLATLRSGISKSPFESAYRRRLVALHRWQSTGRASGS